MNKEIKTYDLYQCFSDHLIIGDDGKFQFDCYNNSEKDAKLFFSSLDKLIFFDNPDGYIKFSDYTLIIEHFEFDSSINNKKGSESRRKINEAEKKMEMNRNNIGENNFSTITIPIKLNATTENLKNNFIYQFKKHVNKKNQYRNNLLKKGIISNDEKIKFLICCEDKSIGPYTFSNNKLKSFNILNIIECIEEIEKSDLDYIVTFNKYETTNLICFAKTQDLSINTFNKKYSKDIELVNYNLCAISAAFRINS